MNFTTLYYAGLWTGAVVILLLLAGCIALLVKAFRERRLSTVLAASVRSTRSSADARATTAAAVSSPVGPFAEGPFNVNPTTGQMMLKGMGVDTSGTPYGVAPPHNDSMLD